MAGTATAERAPTQGRSGNGEKAEQVSRRPFIAGSRGTDQADFDDTRNLTTATQRLPINEIVPQGFLGGIWIIVEATAAGNTATVAFADDSPFNILETINLKDVSNKPMCGPMSGYDLYIIDKYGGYFHGGDPKASPVYSVTSGTPATAGSFTAVLFVPVEIVHRDAFGPLANTSASATFSLDMSLNASGTVYDTAPSTLPSVRTRTVVEGWQDPNAVDIFKVPVEQEPLAARTTQYWQKQTPNINSGAFNRRLQSIEGYLRNLIFIARDENGLRSNGDGEFPDPFTFQYEKNLIVDSRPRVLWRHLIAKRWGYDAGTETAGAGSAAASANQRDLGVYPLSWCLDFWLIVGGERRFTYLPCTDATTLAIIGTIGGSGTNQYDILANTVNPVGDPRAMTYGM